MSAVNSEGSSVTRIGGEGVGAGASPVEEKKSSLVGGGGHVYAVVNQETGKFGYTHSSEVSSTSEEIKQFLKDNKNTLEKSDVKFLKKEAKEPNKNDGIKIYNKIIVLTEKYVPDNLKCVFIKIINFAAKKFERAKEKFEGIKGKFEGVKKEDEIREEEVREVGEVGEEKEEGIREEEREKKKEVYFGESEVNVVQVSTNESEKFSVPTNFANNNDRNTGRRAESDENTALKQTKEHYKDELVPSGLNLTSGVNMSTLSNQKTAVGFDQLRWATFNKMHKELKVPKEETKAFEAELNAVLQEVEAGELSINNLDDLKEVVKTRLKNNNSKKEMIDKETFEDLTRITQTNDNVPLDVLMAPEYKELKKSFNDGSWKDGEQKKLTFTSFLESDFVKLNAGIDRFFDDPTTRQVLEQFLTPGKD